MFNPSEFINFVKNPVYLTLNRKKTHTLRTGLKIYLIILLIIGLVNSLNLTIIKVFFTLPIDNSLAIPESFKNQLWIYIVMVAIFAPFSEEIIFRLSLIFNPINISFSISVFGALFIHKISSHLIAVLSFLIIFLIVYIITISNRQFLNSFWAKNFKYIFYFFSILFGLVHASNYTFVEASQFFLIPILIFPQLAIGFVLSFTRIYYEKGFIMCIIIHCLMNLVSVCIYLLEYSRPALN